MFYAICNIYVVLVSVNLSVPVDCEDLLLLLQQVDSANLMGRWASVASSLQIDTARAAMKEKDSFAIDLRNPSDTMTISSKGQCHYFQRNTSLEGPVVEKEEFMAQLESESVSACCNGSYQGVLLRATTRVDSCVWMNLED